MVETKCEKCGQPLTIIPWNIGTVMAFCNNDKCRAYRQPVHDYEKGIFPRNSRPIRVERASANQFHYNPTRVAYREDD
jgi:hypothetical protein